MLYRKPFVYLTMAAVGIGNALTFLSVVIERRIPLRKWARAWRLIDEAHQQDVRRMLTELTMDGSIKRRLGDDGDFRYYPADHKFD